jgi:hypothetical protein
MSIRCIARVVSLGLFTVVGSGLMAIPARAAGTTTLHFYSVQQTSTATGAAGQPITSSNAPLAVGDHVDSTDLNYVGNHKHHASSFSGSDHIVCTVTSASTETCSSQTAIGGSLLLGNDVTVTFNNTTESAQINAGTGKYKNARGTLSETFIANSNNSDATITLTG